MDEDLPLSPPPPADVSWLVLVLLLFGVVLGQWADGLSVSSPVYRPPLIAVNERILPNVSIQGVAVGLMTPQEATHALQQHYQPFLTTPVVVHYGETIIRPTAAQIGVNLAIDEAVQQAATLGHGPNPIVNLWEFFALWQQGRDIPLSLTVDERAMQHYLIQVAQHIDESPQDASLRIANGKVVSTPARNGTQLLVDESMQGVAQSLHALVPVTLTLQTRPIAPSLDDLGIAEAHQYVRALLDHPVTLVAHDVRWTWSPEDIGTMVRLERVQRSESSRSRIDAYLDREQIKARLDEMAAAFRIAPVEPRVRLIRTDPLTPQLQIVQPGADGRQFDADAALDQVITALEQGQREILLPATVVPPGARPDTLDSLGIRELVATGRSSFANSESYRITNIEAGARRMDGVLIPPGGEFSFNQTVGAVDASNGFTQGYAIVDGRTQLEWGGGICQISTTVFRSAFWAGLPITERHYHTFRLTWYEVFEPVGMDATIFTGPGGPDLRFINDTGHWLLMEAVVDTTTAVISINLYGTNPHREVIQVPPRIATAAQGAIEVWVGRIVRNADGSLLREDSFYSYFKPWSGG